MVFCVLCAMKIAICFSFTTCLALDFTARRLSLCLNRFPYYFIRLLVASPHTAALARILLDFSKFLWMIVDTFWTHFPMGSQKKKKKEKVSTIVRNGNFDFSWVFTFFHPKKSTLRVFQKNFPCQRRRTCVASSLLLTTCSCIVRGLLFYVAGITFVGNLTT